MGDLVRVTIDGEPVPIGEEFAPPRWIVCFGTSAPEVTWTLDPELAARVLAKREVALRMEAEDKVLEVARAVVIGEAPTESPYTRGVVLSDIRAYWGYIHVRFAGNLRTRSGSGKLLSVDGPPQNAQIVDEFRFAPFSMKDEKVPHTADEVAAALLEFQKQRTGAGYEIAARARPQLTPNDVLTDSSANVSIAQALGLLGGVDIFVRPQDSVVVLVDRVLGSERKVIAELAPPIFEDLGRLAWVSTRNRLPKKFNVLFTREMEVRADFVEEAPEVEDERATDEPTLTNVIQVTDLSLAIAGQAAPAVMGTFVDVDTWCTAINAAGPQPPGTSQPLDRERFQDLYLGPGPQLLYVLGYTGISPSQVWAARVGSFFAHYRLTFRLDRAFAQRILPGSIRAVRAALIDGPTGTRQPSPVWADHCARPTLRWLAKSREAKLGWNVHSLPPQNGPQAVGDTKPYPTEILLADCLTAPARLHVLDNQVGIFHVEFRRDPFDQAEQIVPSLVRKLPTTNPHEVAVASALATWEQAKLVRNHRVSFIFSCVPAGPNSAEQLGRYEVDLETALERLGVELGDQEAQGPDLDIRIGGSLYTLRYPWSDDHRDEILGAFRPDKPFPDTLTPVNDDEAKDYAQTTAAAAAANLLDHYEGQQGVPFSPGLLPVGSMNTIAHTVDPEGRSFTVVSCEARVPPPRAENLLSPAHRKTLLRELGT